MFLLGDLFLIVRIKQNEGMISFIEISLVRLQGLSFSEDPRFSYLQVLLEDLPTVFIMPVTRAHILMSQIDWFLSYVSRFRIISSVVAPLLV